MEKTITISILFFFMISCAGQPSSGNGAVERNVSYGNHPEQRMDVYLPEGEGPHPLILLVHGGAWHWGDKREYTDTALWLAESGYAVCNMNYRLGSSSGLFSLEDKLDDMDKAIQYMNEHKKEWNWNGRLTLMGGSAGGHLSLLYAFGRGKDTVDAVISYSGPTDLANPKYQTNGIAEHIRSLFPGFNHNELRDAMISGSPLFLADSDCPPVMIIHGTADTTVPFEESDRLADALENAGSEVLLIPVDSADHAFEGTDWDAVGQKSWPWMEEHCR